MSVKTCAGITKSQHHSDQKVTELPRMQSVGLKKGASALLVGSGLAEKWRSEAMECFCYLRNKQKNNWQTESHLMNEDLALSLMGQ